MNFEKEEKKLLILLVEKELESIDEKAESILTEGPILLAAEQKYEDFLKNLRKKLKQA